MRKRPKVRLRKKPRQPSLTDRVAVLGAEVLRLWKRQNGLSVRLSEHERIFAQIAKAESPEQREKLSAEILASVRAHLQARDDTIRALLDRK